jgi:hypothetical protein
MAISQHKHRRPLVKEENPTCMGLGVDKVRFSISFSMRFNFKNHEEISHNK